MVDPLMLKAMITTAVAAYMVLLVLPEPVTKAVAVSLTTILIAYVGWNAFFDILDGWRELSARSERARSFGELEDAGHRFGDVMGRDGARVIIMTVTAALGGGAAHFASKASLLPGFVQAELAAETNFGFELSVALEGGARSVTVAEGVMTVGVAPNVVAAVAAGPPAGASRPDGPGSQAARGLSNAEVRAWYSARVRAIDTSGPLTRETAARVHAARNALKAEARAMMSDRAAAAELEQVDPLRPLDYYIEIYSQQGYSGEGLWQRIIHGGTTPNQNVNSRLGVE